MLKKHYAMSGWSAEQGEGEGTCPLNILKIFLIKSLTPDPSLKIFYCCIPVLFRPHPQFVRSPASYVYTIPQLFLSCRWVWYGFVLTQIKIAPIIKMKMKIIAKAPPRTRIGILIICAVSFCLVGLSSIRLVVVRSSFSDLLVQPCLRVVFTNDLVQ